MIVFRLAKSKYCNDISGKGAEKNGGRWNSEGTAMLYTSISRALCVTEIAVHSPLGNIPSDYFLISIEIPDNISILNLDTSKLNYDWKSILFSHFTLNSGDEFIKENKFLVMKVPSVVVQGEFNFLINPHHADSNKIKIISVEPFVFDERLFTR